jgi:hypothetical protein
MFLKDSGSEGFDEGLIRIVPDNAAIKTIVVPEDVFQFLYPVSKVVVVITAFLTIQKNFIKPDKQEACCLGDCGIMLLHRHQHKEIIRVERIFIVVDMVGTFAFRDINQFEKCMLVLLDLTMIRYLIFNFKGLI